MAKGFKEIILRPVARSDRAILRDMLFQTLLSEPDASDMKREMLDEPDLAWYIEEWGRNGDFGFVATDEDENLLGAVWARLADEDGQGYGFYDYETPEIAIATVPEARGLGVGTRLLETLIVTARQSYPALSLSVAENNPAKKLYERVGFRTISTEGDHSLMVLELEGD
ncbi:MAG: GNAT family N-acetyltransferase [Acidobacteria bacterium]|nr:MAG: GNAT family N-acetyltransferase [Acidobacteriota bacterium]REK01998.1 MAG: GNAT family N-acetyltransferase [Acidobacteriota bacterium]REK14956.1 MAG: GNAT family N-acetyltransferase [Acidobacteriota bacterium]REK45670.1 MAG: GNAT family N-acetyltransferase [Acidobacteriota bacterium]